MIFRKESNFVMLLMLLVVLHTRLVLGLTDSQKQPEYQSFVPSVLKDMVNLSTGDFTYNLPLLVIPTKDGKNFQINLHYSAGIGIEQEASWIGLGWNINVGTISRSVIGRPDDILPGPGKDNKVYFRTHTTRSDGLSLSFSSPGGLTYTMNSYGNGHFTANLEFGIGGGRRQNKVTGEVENYLSISPESGGFMGGAANNYSGPPGNKHIQYSNVWLQFKCPVFSLNSLPYKYDGNYDVNYYGYLYNDLCPRDGITTTYLMQNSNVDFADAMSTMPFIEYDYSPGSRNVSNIRSQGFGVPSSDRYRCVAEGLVGEFQAYKKNHKDESIPTSGFFSRDRIRTSAGDPESIILTLKSGFHYTWDYVLSDKKSFNVVNDFEYRFAYDNAGGFVPARRYYDPKAGSGIDASDNGPQSKKVIPSYNSEGQITGFKVFDNNGVVYNFSKPVWVYCEYNETSNSLSGVGSGKYCAQFSPSNANSVDISTLKQIDNPLYATEWLLTSITGPDYIDFGDPGPDIADAGYWVRFDYETVTNDYIYRVPFSNKNTAPDYRVQLENNEDITSDLTALKYQLSFGKKDLVYLRNIVTNNAVAVFDIQQRADGYESGDISNGNLIGTNSYYKLNKISLYRTSAFTGNRGSNNLWDDAEAGEAPFKVVSFTQDYSLCINTPNSTAGGKLTLTGLKYTGSDGEEMPPYSFYYMKNPAYSHEKWDRWGFYKSDGAGPLRDDGADANHLGVNPEDVDAWSLTKICLPFGSVIDIDYESDSYNYVQNRPLGGAFKSLEKTTDDLSEPGHFYSEDNFPEVPNGAGVYEVRSYAPGLPVLGSPSTYGDLIDEHEVLKYDFFIRQSRQNAERNMITCIIYQNEIPKNFTLSKIAAYAYVAKKWGTISGQNPLADIRIEGVRADGTTQKLRNDNFEEIGSPKWIARTSNNLESIYRDFKYFKVEIRHYRDNIAAVDMLQRDFRVFLLDETANKPEIFEMERSGGGLRVKSISINNGTGNVSTEEYFYDENGNGTGLNTGVATQEPPAYSNQANDDRRIPPHFLGGVIPGTSVMYRKVTVKESGNVGKIEYEFHTPQSDPISTTGEGTFLITDINSYNMAAHGLNKNGQSGLLYFQVHGERMNNIMDRSQIWGLPSKMSKCNESGQPVEKIAYSYYDNKGGSYREVLTPCCLFTTFGDFTDYHYYLYTNKFHRLNPVVSKKTLWRDGVEYSENYNYSNTNGEIEVKEIKDKDGVSLRKDIIEWVFREICGWKID